MKTVKHLLALSLALCMLLSVTITASASAEETTIAKPDVSAKFVEMKQGTMTADGYGSLTGNIATLAVTIQKVPGANCFFVAPLRRIAPGNNFSSFEKTGEGTMPTVIANPGETPKFETINGKVEVGPNGEKITQTDSTITIEKKVCMLDSAAYSSASNIEKQACYKENENIVIEAQAYYEKDGDPSTYKGSEYVYIEFPFNSSSVGKTFTEGGASQGGDTQKEEPKNEAKKPNPMTVSGKAVTVKNKTLKKKKKVVIKAGKAIVIKNAQGKVTYKKTKGNKKITIGKDGKITVKKGLKKGKKYPVYVKVSAAGNSAYYGAEKTVKIIIRVK